MQLAAGRCFELGYIFQTYNLLPVMSALMNVALPTVFAGLSTEEGEERAMECLKIVGLGERAHHIPSELSGGQQQRVAVARALVNDPALILADEPTGNLHDSLSRQVMALFIRLVEEAGSALFLVTHNRDMAAMTDRQFRLSRGCLGPDV